MLERRELDIRSLFSDLEESYLLVTKSNAIKVANL